MRSEQPAGLSIVPANSELVVGRNRFALGLLEAGRPVANAAAKFEFFELEGSNATKRSEADAIFRSIDGTKGLYVSPATFDRAGTWGVQATVTRPGLATTVARANFDVLATSSAPVPGGRAIASHNPTASEVANLAEICSATPPCSLHEMNIASALGLGKPLVIAFATPGYCTSQTCAPVLGEVLKARARRAEQASFLHVEIYRDPRNLVIADTVTEWGLTSEPWIFLVDRAGVIADRIESLTTADEIDATLAPLL